MITDAAKEAGISSPARQNNGGRGAAASVYQQRIAEEPLPPSQPELLAKASHSTANLPYATEEHR